MVLNSLAALGLCDLLVGRAFGGRFESFQGVQRRFEKVATYNGVEIYDDYVTIPQRIATLQAAKQLMSNKKVSWSSAFSHTDILDCNIL